MIIKNPRFEISAVKANQYPKNIKIIDREE